MLCVYCVWMLSISCDNIVVLGIVSVVVVLFWFGWFSSCNVDGLCNG